MPVPPLTEAQENALLKWLKDTAFCCQLSGDEKGEAFADSAVSHILTLQEDKERLAYRAEQAEAACADRDRYIKRLEEECLRLKKGLPLK